MAGTRANCIYFIQSDDPRLYVFDLEDRSFSTSLPCRNISRRGLESNWIRKNPIFLSKIPRAGMACTSKRLELVECSCYPNKKKDEDTQLSSWSDLLPELLSSILSRLFMGDCVDFRTICKSWQSTYTVSPTPDPLIHKHPYLMFLNTKTRLFNFYHPIYNATYQRDIPEIYNADIRFSKDDWLIMSLGKFDVFLFNPFTKTKIELPYIPLESDFSRMYFLSSPTSPDFEVFGFSDVCLSITISRIKLGEKDWTHVEYECPSKFRLAGCDPVMCNGSVYFLGVTRNLGIYDLTSDDDPSWTVCVKPRERFKNSKRRYLVASEGEIFSVFVGHDWPKIDIFKLDFKTMSWKDVESLGDKMLFVSLNSSFSGKAVERGAGNKVYFTRLHGNEGVFYSLKTKKMHSVTSRFLKNDSQEETRNNNDVSVGSIVPVSHEISVNRLSCSNS